MGVRAVHGALAAESEQSVSFTYDITTTTGQIRSIVPDSNPDAYVFEDSELAAFYAIEGQSLKRAAALALETIASNEAMVLKVIRLLDIQTDGAKVSDTLLKRAEKLRDQADDEEIAEHGAFDIAEWAVDSFTTRDLLFRR